MDQPNSTRAAAFSVGSKLNAAPYKYQHPLPNRELYSGNIYQVHQ